MDNPSKIILFAFLIAMFSTSFVFDQSTLAYHEERQNEDFMKYYSGLMNLDETVGIQIPTIEKQYLVRVSLQEESGLTNSTANVAYDYTMLEKISTKLVDRPFYAVGNDAKESIKITDEVNFDLDDITFPHLVSFPIIFDVPGVYRESIYTTVYESGKDKSGSRHNGIVAVVSEYSKAMDENGHCKNKYFEPLPKHDLSTVICVSPYVSHELITRGWSLMP